MRNSLIAVLLFSCLASAQQNTDRKLIDQNGETRRSAPDNLVTIPAGTKVLLVLKQSIWTKNAKENDAVFAATNFPVVIDGQTVIPVGTYVQGVISQVKRPGKVKGRAELLVHFTSLIYPSGYTVLLPGAVDSAPDVDGKITGKEGNVEGAGGKGKDAGTVATSAGTGAVIGSLASRSVKGAGVGGLAGAAVGMASVLFTRGPELKIESGTSVDMVLERPITVDRSRIRYNN
jgi:type IV secretion system protein VirB10